MKLLSANYEYVSLKANSSSNVSIVMVELVNKPNEFEKIAESKNVFAFPLMSALFEIIANFFA